MPDDPAKMLRIECEAHGVLIEEKVFCGHDIEDFAKKVSDAHRSTYGADCPALMTIFLDDVKDYSSRLLPPQQYKPVEGYRWCPTKNAIVMSYDPPLPLQCPEDCIHTAVFVPA